MMSISTSQALLLVMTSAIILMMTSQTDAWSQWVDDDSDSLSLRSVGCTKSLGNCYFTRRCCSPDDVCRLITNRGIPTGYCVRNQRAVSKIRTGSKCSKSSECADGCCREYHLFRVGRAQICGPKRDATTFFDCV